LEYASNSNKSTYDEPGLYISFGNERKLKDQAVFDFMSGKTGNYKELHYQARNNDSEVHQ